MVMTGGGGIVFRRENLPENVHLEQQEEVKRIALRFKMGLGK
jgi:hypothetical protein